VSIGPGWTLLTVMPRLPTSLDSAWVNILTAPFVGRVGHKAWRNGALAHRRTDHDDATAILHVLQRRLRGSEYAADVDVNHTIHLLQRGFFECFWNGRAGIVHKHIEFAEGGHGLFDRVLDCLHVGSVRLNRDSFSASEFNGFDDGRGCASVLRVRDGDVCSIGSQTLRNRCANAPGNRR
jgi:hypothetical protein